MEAPRASPPFPERRIQLKQPIIPSLLIAGGAGGFSLLFRLFFSSYHSQRKILVAFVSLLIVGALALAVWRPKGPAQGRVGVRTAAACVFWLIYGAFLGVAVLFVALLALIILVVLIGGFSAPG
jgi:hypothetical protein